MRDHLACDCQKQINMTFKLLFILMGFVVTPQWCMEEKPLEFEDIVDKTTYDKMRPPKPEGKATMVSFHVTVMSLDTIDEGSMTYAADIFFAQEWKDHRLILPENMTREYRLLPVEWLHLIWRPDSFFKNAKQVTFQTMTIPNHYVWLYKDRTILYMVKLTLLLSCAMHFEHYPHDEQVCKLAMESLSHTTDDLVFIWLPEDKVPLAVDSGIELPQLELVSNVTGDCTSVYSTGNFTCLEVIFKFRRRLGYYLFHTYIPTCLIVMMSWISFWIKPEAVPARVTLGVTSLLTLSTQHANSQKSLPPVSYIKAIDIFMSSCTVFVFLSLIEYAFVNIMMGDISEVERKDKATHLRSILHVPTPNSRNAPPAAPPATAIPYPASANRGRIEEEGSQRIFGTDGNLDVGNKDANVSCSSSTKRSKNNDPKEVMKKRRERAICIDRVSRVIFPSTFILLNIIYWLVFSDIMAAINTSQLGFKK